MKSQPSPHALLCDYTIPHSHAPPLLLCCAVQPPVVREVLVTLHDKATLLQQNINLPPMLFCVTTPYPTPMAPLLPCCSVQPPVVREVLVTLHDEGDSVTVSDMQKVNIHSSKVESVPYAQRPQGHLDENG